MPKPPFFFFLSFLMLFLAVSTSAQSSSSPQSPSAACRSTLYPKLCRSILSSIRFSPSDPYSYGKFSVKQSLKQARKMSNAISNYLTHNKRRSYMSQAEVGALDDCHQLSQLNVDYLESISAELKLAESLNDLLVERVQTLLSAIVTNQQTCYDGLEDSKSSIVNALSEPLKNTTQLYSVSLGLVTHSLNRNLKHKKKKKESKGRNPTKGSQVREPLETLIKVMNLFFFFFLVLVTFFLLSLFSCIVQMNKFRGTTLTYNILTCYWSGSVIVFQLQNLRNCEKKSSVLNIPGSKYDILQVELGGPNL